MDSRERILTALNHKEPDCVPFDLGGTGQTGMHVLAYAALRNHLGLPLREVRARQVFDQGAEMHEDVLELLQADARHVVRRSTLCERYSLLEQGDYWAYRDQWGILWCKPKSNGLYFDPTSPPLAGPDVRERLKQYRWPDPSDPWHYEPLRGRAQAAQAKGKPVVLQGFTAGILETYAWLRGYNDFFLDLGADAELAGYILDALVDIKSAYWERALTELGGLVDVVNESDDLGSQQSLLISPNTYRRLVKPRHKRLYAAIKRAAPHVMIFMHTCGAVRPLIPELIEIGVDILNPVQRPRHGPGGTQTRLWAGDLLLGRGHRRPAGSGPWYAPANPRQRAPGHRSFGAWRRVRLRRRSCGAGKCPSAERDGDARGSPGFWEVLN